MIFGYPYAGSPDAWLDVFGPDGGDVFLADQGSAGRAVCHNPGTYRTICSAVIYGAVGTQAERAALMAAYTDYLLNGLGLEETGREPVAGLRVGPSPVRAGRTVRFHLPPGTRRLTVSDITGRTVADWNISETARLDWTPPSTPGTYIVRARGDGPAATCPLVVVR
ncbi:T9SS type A sorting domain-containing protein [candidate division WOR-3 bacterium]|nr:T9SS type A sorting domain-containing protein [candidate division WOR-3 bacterium]